jgi:predicted phage terminase large subunit-like protein
MSAPTSLADDDRASACRQSFALFNAMAFAAVNPGVALQPAPYLQLLAGKLQQMVDGTVRNLIVTLPPRGLKSFTVSVALPAYILGLDPGRQVMCVSYGQELAQGLGRDRLKLMTHPLYRSTFPESRLSQASVRKLTTPERGGAYATSIDAPATGLGADWLIFDDPQKAQGTLSEQIRTSTNAQFEQTFLSRRNDPTTARIIVVMQRLHEDDFVGHVLGLGGLEWDVLNLPAIAEEDEEHFYETPFGERVFRRKAGEALHPARISVEELREIEKTMGSARFATQYQQRPAPAGGGLVQAKWFNRYPKADLPERFDEVIQSWDTANTISEFADWTVCTTWGRLGESIYLLHVHRERMLFPHLLKAARRMADRFNPDVVLVEDHASGTQLIQMLREQGFGKCRPVKPVGDKQIRMTNQTALIESGRVWLPSDADWVQTYLHELVLFPNARHDDQVDSTSQALDWLSGYFDGRGLLEFYRQEAAAVTKQAEDLPPERLDWPWWKMRCRFDDVTAHCTTGEYRNGEQGWVWIPMYEARDLLHSGNWEKIGAYEPPAKLRAWS